MAFNHGLKIGEVISNKELRDIFLCSLGSGMNRSTRTNTLVLVSAHDESLYHDRWIGNVLHYTGMGKIGDQSFSYMQNKTLFESRENGIEIHFFDRFETGQYTYQGQFELFSDPYFEIQPDENGTDRQACVFPIVRTDGQSTLYTKSQIDVMATASQKQVAKIIDDQEIEKRAKSAKFRGGQRQVVSKQYDRDPYVAEHAKRRANGICQLCDKPAPFKNKKGKPYLETHHVVWMSKGGEDTPENTVALCPNCHKRMHVLDDSKDIQKLLAKIKSLN